MADEKAPHRPPTKQDADFWANDTMEGIDRIFLFNLYAEFAFVGFVVLMALLLKDLWEKKHHD